MQIHLDRNRDKTSSIEVRAGPSLGAPGSNVHDLVASQFSALRLDCALGVVPRKAGGAGKGGRIKRGLTGGREASRQ